MGFCLPCAPNSISSCQYFCAFGKNYRCEGATCFNAGCCAAFMFNFLGQWNGTIAGCQNRGWERHSMCFRLWGGRPGILQRGLGQDFPGSYGYYAGTISTCGCQYFLSLLPMQGFIQAGQQCQPCNRWACNYYCMSCTFNDCDGALNSRCAFCYQPSVCQPMANFAWTYQMYCSSLYQNDARPGPNTYYIPSRCELMAIYRNRPQLTAPNTMGTCEAFNTCQVAQTFNAYPTSTGTTAFPNNAIWGLFFGDGFFCECDRTQFTCQRMVLRIAF